MRLDDPVATNVEVSADGSELTGLLGPVNRGRRRLLGLAGPPGAGKSRLATVLTALADASSTGGGVAVNVPMDGFHLADAELARQGLADAKGAPETFDAWGYAALLERLRRRPGHVVYAPAFDRTLEQPLAAAIAVGPDVELVVTEGNYLLLDGPAWSRARDRLDEVWYVSVADELRRERLMARHVEFGKSPEEARAWVDRVDEPNARLVSACGGAADRWLDLTAWRGAASCPPKG